MSGHRFLHPDSDPNDSNDSDDTAEPGGSGLLRQARGFANAARQARDNCQTGEEAENELRRRRNRSGQ